MHYFNSEVGELNDLNGALLPAPSNKMNETLGKLIPSSKSSKGTFKFISDFLILEH
jgi:hypothetical protein